MKYPLYVLLILVLVFMYLKFVKVSVVICNYKRPYNIDKTLENIRRYPEVGEIIVTHGHPDYFKKFDGCNNIKNYEINNKYGSAQRYFAAREAQNKYVLFLDDDHCPSRYMILKMLLCSMFTQSICGPYKRLCDMGGYKTRPRAKYNSIITPILMCPVETIHDYVNNFDKYRKKLEETHGNGEDLTFNHNFRKSFKKNPIYITGRYHTWDEDTHSYRGKGDHLKIRENWCKNLLYDK